MDEHIHYLARPLAKALDIISGSTNVQWVVTGHIIKEITMADAEKSEFEIELLDLMAKHGVKIYHDLSDNTWCFLDSWDGKVYIPIENLPQADNR